jgi:AcrR family transcriptional regulator
VVGNPGLRERKKERTREALIDAAQELFQRKGYDATTIDEIVAAVEVSRRTFFRYFAGKEEVALARSHEIEQQILDALAERPREEPPLTAIRNAVQGVMAEIAEDPEVASSEAFVASRRLIESNGALLAASLRRQVETERAMADEISRREGLGGARDLRPALVVGLFHSVMRVAMEDWAERGGLDMRELLRIIDEGWARMGDLLAEGWAGESLPEVPVRAPQVRSYEF